ncbi:SgrR family transcriptional regulator [Vibrio mediterranei]|nr:SgrR family transcriptional regulator [Vibrio mediterranei]
MESINLYRYFKRLEAFEVGHQHAVTLSDVAERFFSSPRHTRSILKHLSQAEWITWVPRAGRNQRSTLIRLLSEGEVKRRIASQWVKEGKYDRALEFLDNDQVAFGQLLQQTSGAKITEGRVNVQLTYNRPLTRLVPHIPHRNSERFLNRQLYSCLVSMDKSGELKPDVAHHWEVDPSFQMWTFYIRPSVFFDNGDRVDAETIESLLLHLQQHRYYANELDHLESIDVKPPYVMTINLSRPDRGFAALLTDLKYSIQPPEQLTQNDRNIVGSGVFSLNNHSEQVLSLVANEQYFGLRALTDNVTIWSLDGSVEKVTERDAACAHSVSPTIKRIEPSSRSTISHPAIDFDQNELVSTTSRARIEDGCLFLLFNQHGRALTYPQRRWLSETLSGENVWHQLTLDQRTFGAEIASNFFPFWHNVKRIQSTQPVDLPETIQIAFYAHPGVLRSADAAKKILERQGVKVQLNLYKFHEFIEKAMAEGFEEELIMSSLNLDDNRQVSALLFFLSDPVLHSAIGKQASDCLISEIDKIRASSKPSDYLKQLEQLGSLLIHEGLASPMFHHRQTLSFHGILKGVEITTWGWPQLRDVWSVD